MKNRSNPSQPALVGGLLFVFQSLFTVAPGQTGYHMVPLSGADGVFETIKTAQDTTYRSTGTPGNYQPYMYFQTNVAVLNRTVYVEVTYLDEGYGTMGIDYNSTTSLYQTAAVKHNNYFLNKGGIRKAVFKLEKANFQNGQNMNADLRLFISDLSIRMQVRSAVLYLEPTPFFLSFEEDFVKPYSGRQYTGDDAVDATTLSGKIVTGYQGWFRAIGDPAGQGWIHYANQDFSDLFVDLWPDMQEYSDEEKYPVPGWTYANGNPVSLYSSANKKSVLRHFQWMQTYGIEVAALQRFVVGVNDNHANESFRLPAYVREAANRTGRSYYIMYDMAGQDPATLADVIRDDWQYLVDSMKITDDDRYLHHNGKPVVGVYGFFADWFPATIGNEVLDVFEESGHEAFVAGSGQWWWRTEAAPGWLDVYRRMGAYIPWNVGHINGDYAYTGRWQDDKNDLASHGVLYLPLIFPGFGWDNLNNLTPGESVIERLDGQFMWKQFVDARNIDAVGAYVAMFDEIDESTAIFKVTNDIPQNHYFMTLNGLPSDFYLLMTGFGNDLINKRVGLPAQMPDFTTQSQPSIPEILTPVYEGTVANPVTITWSAASHASGITGYALLLDGQPVSVSGTEYSTSLSLGIHSVQVQATNGLGNKGGYSEKTSFTVSALPTGLPHPAVQESSYRLGQNAPNPFTDRTTFDFYVPEPSVVKISVYNLQGQLVAMPANGYYTPGNYSMGWNGTDLRGNPAEGGVYLYRMVADRFTFTRRMLLIR